MGDVIGSVYPRSSVRKGHWSLNRSDDEGICLRQATGCDLDSDTNRSLLAHHWTSALLLLTLTAERSVLFDRLFPVDGVRECGLCTSRKLYVLSGAKQSKKRRKQHCRSIAQVRNYCFDNHRRRRRSRHGVVMDVIMRCSSRWRFVQLCSSERMTEFIVDLTEFRQRRAR